VYGCWARHSDNRGAPTAGWVEQRAYPVNEERCGHSAAVEWHGNYLARTERSIVGSLGSMGYGFGTGTTDWIVRSEARTIPAHEECVRSGSAPPCGGTEAEVVRRAREAGVAIPAAAYCLVEDVLRERSATRVVCDTSGSEAVSALTLELGNAEVGWWTQGALLSVPMSGENAAYLQRPSTEGVWEIHATAEALTVTDAGACGSPAELLERLNAAEAAPAPAP
jgi:hypothetical protein